MVAPNRAVFEGKLVGGNCEGGFVQGPYPGNVQPCEDFFPGDGCEAVLR